MGEFHTRRADRLQVLRFLNAIDGATKNFVAPQVVEDAGVARSAIARDLIRAATEQVPSCMHDLAAAMRAALEQFAQITDLPPSSMEDEFHAIGKDLTTVALEHGIVPVTPEVSRRLLTRAGWALLDLSDPAWRDILGTALEQHGHPDPQGVIERLDRMGGS